MAARNTHVAINPDDWVEITDSNVTSVTVQNLHSFQYVLLQATSGVAPLDVAGSIYLPAGEILLNETLVDLWPGVSGAVRVFARAQSAADKVFVSHA